MQAISFAKRGLMGGLMACGVLLLGSCGESSGSGSHGFHSKYAVARNALESGDYARAKRSYQKLITEAGPLAARLRLEYAHAELRAGNYAEAAKIAGDLAQGQSGEARGAALAVQGTAQHELGLMLLAEGDGEAGKAQLTQARAALAEVLKSHADLDPLGSMAGRRASISARLQKL
ncbi:outer membrane assembly lipoprotein YfiO [Phaeobacter sp. CECT 5382]|uniref:hypothetical protein n=1 Tax=Phaeobacter sp. CECT 5382 TaxID=1712645 RepID=UPI0006DB5DC9|nr:hypothetical protein [Phaeobacter sp. CECT 5382]CUH89346.1 outer membrane assembly lipoprotein YfiO [Phaeobacter sp. CECT 5382]